MTVTKNSFYTSLLAAAVALASLTSGPGSARADFDAVLTTGEIDIEGFITGTNPQGQPQLGIRVRDVENGVTYTNPNRVLFSIDESVTRPLTGPGASATFDFLGVAPGEEIFVFPTDVGTGLFGGPDVAEPGLRNSARPTFATLNFQFDPQGFSGPGRFSFFTDGGTLLMSSDLSAFGGTTVPNQVNITSHVHFNWAFTQPGDYVLPFRVSQTLDGNQINSEWVNFNFQVVPEPTSFVLMGLGASVFGLALRRRRLRQAKGKGEESLTA
ncbi:hypothetical protein BH23PLA1_BH23PLA1_18190 [soil metagenome]